MARDSQDDEHDRLRFQQRLWGAAALAALAVILLPLLLDGSGSESQFRRVEQLREQPEVLDPEEDVEKQNSSKPIASGTERSVKIRVGEEDPPDYLPPENEDSSKAALVGQDMDRSLVGAPVEALTAWVVQVGSFNQEDNALSVRDELRRAGYPSFVSAAEQGDAGLYRVRIGPMIDEADARKTEKAVSALLGRDAITVRYP